MIPKQLVPISNYKVLGKKCWKGVNFNLSYFLLKNKQKVFWIKAVSNIHYTAIRNEYHMHKLNTTEGSKERRILLDRIIRDAFVTHRSTLDCFDYVSGSYFRPILLIKNYIIQEKFTFDISKFSL